MAQAQVLNTVGAVVSTVELDDSIFGVERNDTLIHQAVLRIFLGDHPVDRDLKRGLLGG